MARLASFRNTSPMNPAGVAGTGIMRRSAAQFQMTLAIDAQTWSMLRLLSAATHMRPVSVP